ncbi:hypothetical protein [Cupriavidus sp. 8B]
MESLFGLLEKTDRGRQEVAARSGALDGRRRALLIMVDGRTSSKEILACAGELGLDASAVFQLLHVGFIRTVSEADDEPAVQSFAEVPPVSAKSEAALQRRSLAAARMYLMDAMVRTFGTTDHPVRRQLIEATDPASVEAVFGEFLGILQEIATPSMAGQIEESFRSLIPVRNQDLVCGLEAHTAVPEMDESTQQNSALVVEQVAAAASMPTRQPQACGLSSHPSATRPGRSD